MTDFASWKGWARAELTRLLAQGKIDPALVRIVKRLNRMPFITVDTCSAHLENGKIVDAPHFHEEFSDKPPAADIIWVEDSLASPGERELLRSITQGIVESLEAVNESWGCTVVKLELLTWTEHYGRMNQALLIWFLNPELGFELLSQVWSLVESVLARYDHEEGTQFTPEMFTPRTPG